MFPPSCISFGFSTGEAQLACDGLRWFETRESDMANRHADPAVMAYCLWRVKEASYTTEEKQQMLKRKSSICIATQQHDAGRAARRSALPARPRPFRAATNTRPTALLRQTTHYPHTKRQRSSQGGGAIRSAPDIAALYPHTNSTAAQHPACAACAAAPAASQPLRERQLGVQSTQFPGAAGQPPHSSSELPIEISSSSPSAGRSCSSTLPGSPIGLHSTHSTAQHDTAQHSMDSVHRICVTVSAAALMRPPVKHTQAAPSACLFLPQRAQRKAAAQRPPAHEPLISSTCSALCPSGSKQ